MHSLSPSSNVLITGVTGLIGGELFRRLMSYVKDGTVWPLIRPTAERAPDSRLQQRLARSGDARRVGPNVRAVPGDVLDPDWGMDDDDLAEVVRGVDVIIHNAAETSFSPQQGIVKTNVAGVRRLIRLAEKCERTPLIVYMSTASNVGDVTGCCVSEDDGCRPENHHHNQYTRSKAVAENLLRESGLPLLTLRPTIVLSAGLPDPQFARQILWFVPITRLFDALPIDPAAKLDVVDVGFVADSALALMTSAARAHDCYHLSAGTGQAFEMRRLPGLLEEFYHRKTPFQMIPPREWTPAHTKKHVRTEFQRRLFTSLEYYFPFLNMNVVFDDSRLRRDLGASAPRVCPVEDYVYGLLRLIRTTTAVKEAALP